MLATHDAPHANTYGFNPSIAFLTVPYADTAILRCATDHPCTDPAFTALDPEVQCGYIFLAVWQIARLLVRLPRKRAPYYPPLDHVTDVFFPIWNSMLQTPWVDIDANILNDVTTHLTSHVEPPASNIWTALSDRLQSLRITPPEKGSRSRPGRMRMRQLAYTMLVFPNPLDLGPYAIANGIVTVARAPHRTYPPDEVFPLIQNTLQQVYETRRMEERDEEIPQDLTITNLMAIYVSACEQYLWVAYPQMATFMPDRQAHIAAGGDDDWVRLRTEDQRAIETAYPVLPLQEMALNMWTTVVHDFAAPNYFDDKYRSPSAETALGKGAFGTVWRAVTTTPPHELRAIKRIENTPAEDVAREALTLRMLGTAATAESPFVRVYDVHLGAQQSDISMDLYQGELYRLVIDPKVDGVMLAVLAARDLSAALAFIHARGILHMDIKPENVLYRMLPGDTPTSPPRLQLVLSDFGLAKWLGAARADELLNPDAATRYPTGNGGTNLFQAPEFHLRSTRTATFAMDVWQLGTTLLNLFYKGFVTFTTEMKFYRKQVQKLLPANPTEGQKESVGLLEDALYSLRWCGFPSRADWSTMMGNVEYAQRGAYAFPRPLPPVEPDPRLWNAIATEARDHGILAVGIRQMLAFLPEQRSSAQDVAAFWNVYTTNKRIEPRIYSRYETNPPWRIYEVPHAAEAIQIVQGWGVASPPSDPSDQWIATWMRNTEAESATRPATSQQVRCLVRLTTQVASGDVWTQLDELKGLSDVTRAALIPLNQEFSSIRKQSILHDIYFGGAAMSAELRQSALRRIIQELQSNYADVFVAPGVLSILPAPQAGWVATPSGLMVQRAAYHPLCMVRRRLATTPPEDKEFAPWLESQEFDASLATDASPYVWFSYNAPMPVLASPILSSWILTYLSTRVPVWFGVRKDLLKQLTQRVTPARDALATRDKFGSIMPRTTLQQDAAGSVSDGLVGWMQRALRGEMASGVWADAPNHGWSATTRMIGVNGFGLLLTLGDRIQLVWRICSDPESSPVPRAVQVTLLSMWAANPGDGRIVASTIEEVARVVKAQGPSWSAVLVESGSSARVMLARSAYVAWDVKHLSMGAVDVWMRMVLPTVTSSGWQFESPRSLTHSTAACRWRGVARPMVQAMYFAALRRLDAIWRGAGKVEALTPPLMVGANDDILNAKVDMSAAGNLALVLMLQLLSPDACGVWRVHN